MLALPVFCSDPLSSVAYATEAIIVALSVGGLALYHAAPYVAGAVAILLVVVTASYRQTVYAYPNGGGAYVVASENLGRTAGLAAASALLVDYVLTVAVSIAAGVSNIAAAATAVRPHLILVSLGFLLLLTVVNLRGVRESGRVFAIPTYGFVFGMYVMFAWAGYQGLAGHTLRAETAGYGVAQAGRNTGILAVILILRAFANGCTALTGVEAISNGVPAFQPPKSRNAAQTLAGMAFLAVTMFVGITVLALSTHVHMAEQTSQLIGLPKGANVPTAISQVSAAVFGKTFFFYYNTVFTAGILILAANTAFNGFPALASILARDRFLPRQLYNRGDRLVFSNGIVLLAAAAGLLLWAFKANTNNLIHLYIIGVFVSFTLSQAGMVRHWEKVLAGDAGVNRRQVRRSQVINLTGAGVTGLVLVIVLLTKFLEGAWIVVVAMPLIFLLMRGIRRHYDRIARELELPLDAKPTRPSRNHVIVLVSRLHLPTMRALDYALALHPDVVEALYVGVAREEARALEDQWAAHDIRIPLRVLDSPYREITRPVVGYVRKVRAEGPRDAITVVIPEYVVGKWWEQLLHNQSALRIKARLLFEPGVAVTSVPWQLDGAEPPRPPRPAARRQVPTATDRAPAPPDGTGPDGGAADGTAPDGTAADGTAPGGAADQAPAAPDRKGTAV